MTQAAKTKTITKTINAKRPLGVFLLLASLLTAGLWASQPAFAAEGDYGRPYLGWATNADGFYYSLQVAPAENLDDSAVVYCFNTKRGWPAELEPAQEPEPSQDQASGHSKYIKTLGTAQSFTDLAEAERVTGQALHDNVLRVLVNGYPNNASQIKEKNGLTDGQFRQATQFAVWYFSDSTGFDNSALTTNQRNAVRDLVGQGEVTLVQPERNLTLDIFISQDESVQHLIGSILINAEHATERPDDSENSENSSTTPDQQNTPDDPGQEDPSDSETVSAEVPEDQEEPAKTPAEQYDLNVEAKQAPTALPKTGVSGSRA